MPNRRDEQPTHVATEDNEIDQALADSFPASDAPPWTLGVAQPPPANDQMERTKHGNR